MQVEKEVSLTEDPNSQYSQMLWTVRNSDVIYKIEIITFIIILCQRMFNVYKTLSLL